MTLDEANLMLSAPLFDNEEMALIKMLVLESLSKYDSLSEANRKGNIYRLLKQTQRKIYELNDEL
tara:strand:+ start:420 stop:614 length:195 start_codon:yes stop_codon:yes gene_type:complete